jgi:hypothetical protein
MTPAQTLPTLDDTYRKQRRRECHNQVEKRRREHINAKIEELSQLLPPHYNEPEEVVEDEEDEEPAVSPLKKKVCSPLHEVSLKPENQAVRLQRQAAKRRRSLQRPNSVEKRAIYQVSHQPLSLPPC